MHRLVWCLALMACSFQSNLASAQPIRAEVNLNTGDLSFVGTAQPALFNFYQILSPSSSLDFDQWNSLEDQNLDALGPGDAQRWLEFGGSDDMSLTEGFLTGGTRLSPGEVVSLGNIFVLPLGVGDGDYTGDSQVTAADYNVWRDNKGRVVPPLTLADGNGSGQIGAEDYNIWRDNKGRVGGIEDLAISIVADVAGQLVIFDVNIDYLGNSGASVPEPHGLLLVLCAAVGALMRDHRRPATSAAV